MKVATISALVVAAIIEATSAHAENPSGWKRCTSGWNPETSTFKTLPPKWATKGDPDFNPHDGRWQHSWCNAKRHKIMICFWGSSDEELATCDRELRLK
jgi:hypothetical protein